MMSNQSHDAEFDVLVIGSGASGMATAVTAASQGLKVLVVEKGALYGGTTARSGGWLWVPGTHLATEQGIHETPGAAKAYLKDQGGTHYDEARVDAFLANGPKAIEFFTSKTCLQFDMPPVFPDYHAEAPGGTAGGRSMVTRPFDARQLGDKVKTLAPPVPELTVFGMMLGSGKELWHFLRAFKSGESFLYVAKRFGLHFLDVLRHGRGMTLTNGNALAGRLAKAGMDLGIPVWLNSPAKKLIMEGDSIVGAVIEHEGQSVEVRVRRGVVLAAGGFPHDIERRKQLFPHAPTGREHFTPSPTLNTGDGVRLGESAKGWLDPTIPNAAAWCPTSLVPRSDGSTGVMPHFIDRAKPGVIAVAADGHRFSNEAFSYHDFVQDLVKACKQRNLGEVMCWLICDHHHLREYGLGAVAKFPLPIGRHLRSGYLKRADTLAQLAQTIGVPEQALAQEVATFNRDVPRGVDSQFAKGSTAYNRYQGDSLVQPNPCMAPIAQGPFYAIRVVVGEIGTFAGLLTDAACRVLTQDRQVVPGLYAVGNDAASVMGGNYPGAGITLGPAITFGYVAGMQLASGASVISR
ncbi:FAD-dependent oxidoreductase [Limnohabitans sp.]|jgi:succinate dehydrogenase/fumarate reductase flavoprotein subunit|uniref:FAD-dependent oxidoreductase n=1 Tax=Limnohabitans sp. TaxID=1907725 RepID=UPI0037BFE7D6